MPDWERARDAVPSSDPIPFPVVLDQWLQRYPGMTPDQIRGMDYREFQELGAVQYGDSVARCEINAKIKEQQRRAGAR